MWLCLALVLLLTGQVFCQCFTETDCTGRTIQASNERECCVETDDGLAFGDGDSCTVCIVHGFAGAVYYVMEGESLDTSFQLNVKGMTNISDVIVIEGVVTAEVHDDNDEPADFLQLGPIDINLNSQNGIKGIHLVTMNDDITLEYDGKVVLTFAPQTAGNSTDIENVGEYIRRTATVNVIDTDRLEINFEASNYTIAEGFSEQIYLHFKQNQNPFNVTLSAVSIVTAVSKGLGIFLDCDRIHSISRATADDDFTTSTVTITVPENRTTFRLPQFFSVLHDDINENEQNFAIVAEIGVDVPDSFTCFQTPVEADCFGRSGATTIRIEDNDPMIIGFTARSQTVAEGDATAVGGLVEIAIQVEAETISERKHRMVFRHLANLSTADDEATLTPEPFFDAVFKERTFELLPGEKIIPTLATSVRNDARHEEEECYSIGIVSVDIPEKSDMLTWNCNDDDDATNHFCKHTICIEDDDKPFVVAFVQTTYTVVEGEGPVEVCVNLTHPLHNILDETVSVSVISDESSIYIPAGARLATPDKPDSLDRYHMTQRTDYAQQTAGGNLIKAGVITEEMRTVCYNQTIYDDMRLEVSEYTGLRLGIHEATALTEVQPMYSTIAIKIVDDDLATVGLKRTLYRALENDGVVEVCAVVVSPNILCPIEFPFIISFSTTDSSAGSPTDYEAQSVILDFAACEAQKCVNVYIVDDSVYEQDERFYCTLERTSGLDPRITFESSSADILIVDNDVTCFTDTECNGTTVPANSVRECCVGTNEGLSWSGEICTACVVHGFTQAVYDLEERLDTRFELNVKGRTNFPGALTIQGVITAMPGGTASGSDFEALRPISFTNEAEIRLFINNDDKTLEYDDSIILTFNPANPALIPGLEGVGEYVRDTAVVNIIDSDRLEINLEEADYFISEGSQLFVPIRLQFRENQNPFNITLTPVTIATAEANGLGVFINSIEEEARASGIDIHVDSTLLFMDTLISSILSSPNR